MFFKIIQIFIIPHFFLLHWLDIPYMAVSSAKGNAFVFYITKEGHKDNSKGQNKCSTCRSQDLIPDATWSPDHPRLQSWIVLEQCIIWLKTKQTITKLHSKALCALWLNHICSTKLKTWLSRIMFKYSRFQC